MAAASLVRRSAQGDDEPRFDMLETIREYGLEILAEAGDEQVIRRRVADYYQKRPNPR